MQEEGGCGWGVWKGRKQEEGAEKDECKDEAMFEWDNLGNWCGCLSGENLCAGSGLVGI